MINPRATRALAGWILLVMVLILGGCKDPPKDTRPPEKLWKEVCATCHGMDGRGISHKLGKRINMRSTEWQESISDEEIADAIINGKKGNKRMPAFGKRLTDEQVQGLVKFVREKIPQ